MQPELGFQKRRGGGRDEAGHRLPTVCMYVCDVCMRCMYVIKLAIKS